MKVHEAFGRLCDSEEVLPLSIQPEGIVSANDVSFTQSPKEEPMNGRIGAGVYLLAGAAVFFLSMMVDGTPGHRMSQSFSVVEAAGEDGPTGGGTGCRSNGNCQGTVYKDKSNLDRWWYPVCSGCHTPQTSATTNPPAPLSVAQRKFIGDAKAFWALHAQAQSDPVLRAMLPKSRLRPIQTLSPEFRALVKR